MTPTLRPGHPAKPEDLLRAQDRDRLLDRELPAVREAALAWRNGLGALLAALVGFGLIKGRSEVSELASPWDVVSGLVLLAALVSGAVAAVLLLRAAHGSPALQILRNTHPGAMWAHAEAVRAARVLRFGIYWFFGTVTCLILAVAVTWYGPGTSGPELSVTVNGETVCGSVVDVQGGVLELETSTGDRDVRLQQVIDMRAVSSCDGDSSSGE